MKLIWKKRIAAALATGAILLNAVTPALAATTIEISGNGTGSTNGAGVSISQTTTVVQTNNADVDNYVNADADTGKNDANDNTGGDVSIDTGNATTDVKVSNDLNTNVAKIDCCDTGDTTVKISGNGSDSENGVELNKEKVIEVFQSNNADIDNDVYADADTGKNDANDNTGGSVSIDTGNATVMVDVSNKANTNVAEVSGDDEGGDLSVWITGNGTGSKNFVGLGLLSEVLLVQENKADVDNYVNADADTGKNDANDNTGGDVTIDTGNAKVDVDVDNELNFNWANVDCDCIIDDITVKIAGNGSDSENGIEAEIAEALEVFQSNCGENGGLETLGGNHHEKDCEVDNDVYADADTGKNDTNDNTGDPDGDPSIDTGNAESNVEVGTSGNMNVYGEVPDLDLPDFGLDFDLDISIDLGDLLDFLGLV